MCPNTCKPCLRYEHPYKGGEPLSLRFLCRRAVACNCATLICEGYLNNLPYDVTKLGYNSIHQNKEVEDVEGVEKT